MTASTPVTVTAVPILSRPSCRVASAHVRWTCPLLSRVALAIYVKKKLNANTLCAFILHVGMIVRLLRDLRSLDSLYPQLHRPRRLPQK